MFCRFSLASSQLGIQGIRYLGALCRLASVRTYDESLLHYCSSSSQRASFGNTCCYPLARNMHTPLNLEARCDLHNSELAHLLHAPSRIQQGTGWKQALALSREHRHPFEVIAPLHEGPCEMCGRARTKLLLSASRRSTAKICKWIQPCGVFP